MFSAAIKLMAGNFYLFLKTYKTDCQLPVVIPIREDDVVINKGLAATVAELVAEQSQKPARPTVDWASTPLPRQIALEAFWRACRSGGSQQPSKPSRGLQERFKKAGEAVMMAGYE